MSTSTTSSNRIFLYLIAALIVSLLVTYVTHATWAVAAIFIIAAIESSFDPQDIWERVKWADAPSRRAVNPITEVTR